MKRIIRKIVKVNAFLCVFMFLSAFQVNEASAQENGVYALSYHVGAYDVFPEANGELSVTIDGTKYYYSEEFDSGEIETDISKMENQNVVFELHENRIVKVYTMDKVMISEVTVEPGVKDGIIYKNGKFSPGSFDLVVKISNHLQGAFQENDLLWFLSDTEKERLYLTLKKLEIQPSNEVDFGSTGWWMWKEYQTTISENLNDTIKVDETKTYQYTVNLHNNSVMHQSSYIMEFYTTPTFDTGAGERTTSKIEVGNLDYQEEKTVEKKATSNSGQSVTQASTKLDGIQSAIQFSKDYFSADQTDQINEFVNIWMSELLLAKYVNKSELKEKVSEEIANKLLEKLGLDTSVLAIPGEIQATTYLKTQTKSGTNILIQFNIKLLDFDFGNSGMPTMATGSGTAVIYNMDGEEMDSSVILPAYANVCAFCEQLQKVAKDTIFSGAKEYLGIFGISAEGTAEELSSKMMEKILNNKYAKKVFKRIDARDVKTALKKIITEEEKKINNKIFELVTIPSQGSTEVNIKCPVDVKIYDNDGNLCGLVKDNIVDSAYDDIFVNVVGDQKNIYLIGDDYSFEMTGTDDGSMDYVVREFDDGGNKTREITYENIKLSNGCKYYSYVPEAANHSSVLFDLTDGEGNVISPTTGADEDISVIASGTCGDNVFWKLLDDSMLRIWGNGSMHDFYRKAPWQSYGNNSQIENIIIEDGVTSIGSHAFYLCNNLANIEIPSSIQKIGSYAFGKCKKITAIKIPDGVEIIGTGAFYDCTSLSTVILPNTVKMMGYGDGGVFDNCQKLKTAGPANGDYDIQFNWTTEIPDNAFRGCSGLEKVLIPESVETMGQKIFSGCDNLKTAGLIGSDCDIQFGWKREIPETAFWGCSSLEDINIPETVTRIGDGAFGNTGLKNLNLCKNILEIGSQAFYNCRNLENIYYDVVCLESDREAEYTYTKYIFSYAGMDTSGVSVTIGDDVTDIPDYIFYGGYDTSNIKNLKIGKNVEYIGIQAFRFCRSIEKIYYNAKHVTSYDDDDSITYMVPGPFDECSGELGLELIIGDDVEYIPNRIFSTGDSHGGGRYMDFACRKISMGKNVREINHAFTRSKEVESFEVSDLNNFYMAEDGVLFSKDRKAILCHPAAKKETSFSLPETVLIIEEDAFMFCANLTELKLNSNLQTIKRGAFWGCSNLETLLIPGNVSNIEKEVFSGCDKLQTMGPIGGDYNIQIGQMREIPCNAFQGCDELRSVIIPEGVAMIGDAAFGVCDKLTSISIPKSVVRVGSCVFEGTAWMHKKKEAGEVVIAGSVLYDARSYKGYDYIVPDDILVIAKYAFSGCDNIRSIVLPDKLMTIENDAFADCHLSSIVMPESLKVIEERAFFCCDLRTVTIPSSVTRIGAYAFSHNQNLTSIVMQEGLKVIEECAFWGCSLRTITIPSSVTDIGSNAFNEDGNFREIYMCGNAPTDTHEEAFFGFDGNLYITPNAVGYDTIPWLNYNIIVKKDIVNPEIKPDDMQMPQDSDKSPMNNQQQNGDQIETNYSLVNTVTVGVALKDDKDIYTVTSVDSNGGTVLYTKPISKNIAKVMIPATVKLDGAIYKVTGIASRAFLGCTKLKTVTIGKNVTTVGAKAFSKCKSLTKITLPASVTKIGNNAFKNCKNLKKLIIKSKKLTKKSLGKQVFKGLTKKTVVQVPKKKLKAYKKLLKQCGLSKSVKVQGK